MKLLVAGSRDYANQSKKVIRLLDALIYGYENFDGRPLDFNLYDKYGNEDGKNWVTEIVSGCAKGIDTAAILWAEEADVPVKKYPAQWNVNGHTDMAAGFKRNALMAEYCDTAIIIWDGKSRGTKHMMSELDKRGKEFLLWTALKVRKMTKETLSLGV